MGLQCCVRTGGWTECPLWLLALKSGLGPTSGPEVAPRGPETKLLGVSNIVLSWHYW